MTHVQQAGEFYRSLCEEERLELCKTIAEDIFFLEEALQDEILALLHDAEPEIRDKIREINCFTTG